MKRTFFHAAIMAGVIAVSISALLDAQGPSRTPPLNATSPPVSTGTNVGVIDIKYIFDNHPRFKAQMDAIAKEAKEYDENAMQQKQSLAKMAENLRRFEAGSNEYRKLEEDIAKKDTDLKVEFTRKQRELVDRRSKIFYDAYKEIEELVGQFADKFGFDLILRFDSTEMEENNRESIYQGVNRGVVFQRNRDITKAIAAQLVTRQAPNSSASATPPPPQGRSIDRVPIQGAGKTGARPPTTKR